jgi:OFA family oxalate/formate antiporter-like MFS transporter
VGTPRRWVPVFGAALLNLTLGSVYAWSVFVLPLEHEFGWTRRETSWVFTILMVSTTICVVLAGTLQDRFGPRVGALIGAASIGLAYLFASSTRSLLFLYGTFGLVAGIGNGVGYATAVPVASKWFPEKRGLAVGMLVGAYGAGSAIIGPLAASLIGEFGWRVTFRALGTAFLLVGITGALLIRNPPSEIKSPSSGAPNQRGVNPPDLSTSAMLRLPTFYILWIAYCCGTTAGMMTISQLVPFARSAGLSATAATFALTVGAVGNTGGRVLSGWMSDTLGRLHTLRAMVTILVVAMPALFLVRHHPIGFYLFVAVVYWCYGTQLSVFAAASADFFGTRFLGMNYGALFTAVGFAGVMGPILGAQVFDRFGDYRYAFYASGALAGVALIALTVARQPRAETIRLTS